MKKLWSYQPRAVVREHLNFNFYPETKMCFVVANVQHPFVSFNRWMSFCRSWSLIWTWREGRREKQFRMFSKLIRKPSKLFRRESEDREKMIPTSEHYAASITAARGLTGLKFIVLSPCFASLELEILSFFASVPFSTSVLTSSTQKPQNQG